MRILTSLFYRRRMKGQLQEIVMHEPHYAGEPADILSVSDALDSTGRLARAGFLTPQERVRAQFMLLALISVFSIFMFFSTRSSVSSLASFVILCASAYFGFFVSLLVLKAMASVRERETLFRLPLFLESVILLVESGLGVLPALQKVVSEEGRETKRDPVSQVMKSVYDLSAAGLPFSQALEIVSEKIENKPLRHVLLHLDVSSSEGGALVPSLRGLSEFAHREWKLSVEARVKRLENLVVFPVFASVIGLMIVTVAVPIVPVVDFFGSLESRQKNVISAEKSPSFRGAQ